MAWSAPHAKSRTFNCLRSLFGSFGRDRVIRSKSANMEPLWEPTEYQRNLLRRTWLDDFDFLYELGADIYEVIFTQAPDSINLFPSVAQHGENWRNNKQFRNQALKFVQVLDQGVKNVQRPDSLEPMLRHVGRAHRKYSERGFKPSYWDVFQQAIEVAMTNHISNRMKDSLTEQEKRDAVQTWKLFALFLVAKMRLGFSESSP